MKSTVLVVLAFLMSCNNDRGILITQDTWGYSTYDYHLDQRYEDSSVYRLSRRYFVRNYPKCREEFDSAVSILICRSLNDSLIVSRLDYDFQDAGYMSAGDTIKHQWSATFTRPAEYFIWHITDPDVLTIERREANGAKVTIDFECELKEAYGLYLD